jgi:hypothetical protein
LHGGDTHESVHSEEVMSNEEDLLKELDSDIAGAYLSGTEQGK